MRCKRSSTFRMFASQFQMPAIPNSRVNDVIAPCQSCN